MPHGTITTLTLAAAGNAPVWIAGWIIVLLIVIGVPAAYHLRKRNRRSRQTRDSQQTPR